MTQPPARFTLGIDPGDESAESTFKVTTFVLPLRLAPLQNVLLRKHWASRKKLQDQAFMLMLKQHGRRKTPVPGRPRVRVFRRSTQCPDGDSGYGGKLGLDCLKRLGWIRDDSDDAIELSFGWRQAKRGAGDLAIEVWEVES